MAAQQNHGTLYDYIDGDGQLVTVYEWAVRATRDGVTRLIRVWAESEADAKRYVKDGKFRIVEFIPVCLE